MGEDFRRDSHAFVLNRHHNAILLPVELSRTPDASSVICDGLTGILNEVDHDLLKTLRISFQGGKIIGKYQRELIGRFLDHVGNQGDGRLHDRIDVHRLCKVGALFTDVAFQVVHDLLDPL